jgi:hypothetical protein
MREIMHLRIGRFLVEVFQQNQSILLLGVVDEALQALQPGIHPQILVRGEMIAGVHDNPLCAEPRLIPLSQVHQHIGVAGEI